MAVPTPIIRRKEIVKRIEVPVSKDVMENYRYMKKFHDIIDASNDTYQDLKVEKPQWGNYWNMKNAGRARLSAGESKLERAQVIGGLEYGRF